MASLYNYGLYLLKQNKFNDFLNKFMKKWRVLDSNN
jgi:hypothetical protein